MFDGKDQLQPKRAQAEQRVAGGDCREREQPDVE